MVEIGVGVTMAAIYFMLDGIENGVDMEVTQRVHGWHMSSGYATCRRVRRPV